MARSLAGLLTPIRGNNMDINKPQKVKPVPAGAVAPKATPLARIRGLLRRKR